MKKALTPILALIGLMILLAAAAYVYEQKWGVEGPFPSQHHHGGAEPADAADHDHDHDHEH